MKREKSDYIVPQSALNRLFNARRTLQPVYIYGMSSYGKTELVRQFFSGKTFCYYSSNSKDSELLSDFESHINPKRKMPLPVVFDDLQFVNDEEKQNRILEIAERDDVWPIFIARPPLLGWLVPYYTQNNFVVIGENELALTVDQIREFFFDKKIHITNENIEKLQEFIVGNPYALKVAATRLQNNPDAKTLIPHLREVFSKYMMNSVTKVWPPEFLNFFIQLSPVDSFTIEMAEYITGNPFAPAYIEKARSIANFVYKKDDVYLIRPIPLEGFRYQFRSQFGTDKINEISRKAAEWYENHEEFEKAMVMYTRIHCTSKIKEILIKNSSQNPSNGQYLGLSRYYFELSESEIEENVVLMSGMSMICSMLFKTELSEYWYNKIKEKVDILKGEEKTEAKRRIAYLDIALPHRGSTTVLDSIKSIGVLLTTKGLKLPEFSVTSNLPSAMNGGKDFCDWSLKDRAIAKKYGNLIALVLGKNGKPIVNLALAESFWEKAGDNEEILSLLSRGQLESDLNDNLEMGFVASGLFIRFYLMTGQLDIALLQYTAFERKCRDFKCTKFFPNLLALQCRIDLYRDDSASTDMWLKTSAPDENKEIFALFRLQYMTKIRCYIAKNRLSEAFSLKEKMKWYAENYHRTYISIECDVLGAIINYRLDSEWKDVLKRALSAAEKYQFVRIISDEGAAILPLLLKIKEEFESSPEFNKNWFAKVIRESQKLSKIYPKYCAPPVMAPGNFSETARQILRLQCEGLSADEISKNLDIKLETVRYHIKQNYKKLGVNSKSRAIIMAKELYLV